MNRKITYILLLVCSAIYAQRPLPAEFIPPFDFPLLLSGNFGELRSNHFHGGVDFKTQGVVGKPVSCIADGYVSRVTVSAGGYGNALYITHDNGYTSVYGHLLAFAEPIAAYVKTYQLEHETFAVDLCPDSSEFVFKTGERIALAGNSGYSFGPHLHLEIRRTATNEPVDPLRFYQKQVKDTRPPVARELMFYPRRGRGVVNGEQTRQSFSVKTSATGDALANPVEAWGEIGVGIKAYDYMDDTSNRYGVQTVMLYVDSVEVFSSCIDAFSYAENRMLNSWTDFAEFKTCNSWFMKSFIEPGNSLRLLRANANDGFVCIDEERPYQFCYVLKDLHGNSSTYSFVVQGRQQNIPSAEPGKHRLRWDRLNLVQEPGLHLIIPRDRLYDDVSLHTSVVADSGAVSFEYRLHTEPVPLHRACDLLIGIRNKPIEDISKYYIAHCHAGRLRYVGGSYEDGWLRASILELGTYKIAVDTVPPQVVPLNKASWRRSGTISYRISDKETGIKQYRATIDGRFALFAFDLKSGRLTYKANARPGTKGTQRKLELIVEDNCGNVTRVEELLN